MLPDAVLSAIPCAMTSLPESSPRRRPAPRAQPNAPTSPVGWKPWRWKPPRGTEPMRAPASTATTYAATTSAPDAPRRSPSANVQGKALAVAWMIPGTWVSS